MILLEYWDIARGHSDIAALSVFSVCHALHLVSEYHALLSFFFPSLVLISCLLELSFPSHTTTSYLFFILSLIMALFVYVYPPLSLCFMPSFSSLSYRHKRNTLAVSWSLMCWGFFALFFTADSTVGQWKWPGCPWIQRENRVWSVGETLSAPRFYF